MNWDEYFIGMVNYCSQKSKDPHTKVGAVAIGPNKEIRSTGYNGLPRGIDDSKLERFERPEKYFWFEHAERNCVYNAARSGIALDGCILYVSGIPCIDCARACVQVGIKEVVADASQRAKWESNPKWIDSMERSKRLFDEAGVKWRYA